MSSSINFFAEGISYTIKHKRALRVWITATAIAEGASAGDINFIFCEDKYLVRLNRKYLNHNTLTDIITFPLVNDEGVIGGDIYISIDRVRENARLYGKPVFNELSRVMIHGILHLLGYNDESEAEKAEMRKLEDFYIEQLSTPS